MFGCTTQNSNTGKSRLSCIEGFELTSSIDVESIRTMSRSCTRFSISSAPDPWTIGHSSKNESPSLSRPVGQSWLCGGYMCVYPRLHASSRVHFLIKTGSWNAVQVVLKAIMLRRTKDATIGQFRPQNPLKTQATKTYCPLFLFRWQTHPQPPRSDNQRRLLRV